MRCESVIIHSWLVLAGGILFASGGRATAGEDHKIECPRTVMQDAIQISHPPAGWTASVGSDLRLSSAEPTFGPPSERGFLKPSYTKSSHGKGVDRWDELAGPMPNGKWLACNYGGRNEVTLAKRLDDNTTECTIAYAKDKRGDYDIDIHCKW